MTITEFADKNRDKFGIDLNEIMDAYNEYFKESAKVGDGATVCWWSDSKAYTIVKRTAQTLTLRRCKATLSTDFKPNFIPGGFCGTVINQNEQTYSYEEDENGEIITARWSKVKRGFYWNGMYVKAGRSEFYDYNF